MFESLAVASRPLQRRPRRNNLVISLQRTRRTRRGERVPQIARICTESIRKAGTQEPRKGISEVEGKGARVAASEWSRRAARHRWENRQVECAGANESKREPSEFQCRKRPAPF